jgi:hypothetical protein
MAQHRPSKRARVGGAYHDSIPFVNDFSLVHAREGRLLRVSNDVRTAPAERSPQHEAADAWNDALTWLPMDDPDYALDPDGDWYDEALGGDVMSQNEATPVTIAQKKKRVRSTVSVRLDLSVLEPLILISYSEGLMSFGRTSIAKHTWRR